jgi:hypothetical protein
MATLIHYHAVLLDECGHEFGAGVTAASRDEAEEKLRGDYPENRGILQLDSPADTRAREQDLYEPHLDELDDYGYDDDIWEGECDCGTPIVNGQCHDCDRD